jgi:hypothetical protein
MKILSLHKVFFARNMFGTIRTCRFRIKKCTQEIKDIQFKMDTTEVVKTTMIVVLVVGSCWIAYNTFMNMHSCDSPFYMQGYPRTPLYSVSGQGDENFSSYNQRNRLPGTFIDSNNGCQPYPPYADPAVSDPAVSDPAVSDPTQTPPTQGWPWGRRNQVPPPPPPPQGWPGNGQVPGQNKQNQGWMNPRTSLQPYNSIGSSNMHTQGMAAPVPVNMNTGARAVYNSYSDFGTSAVSGTGNNPAYSSFGTGPNRPLTEGDIVETNRDVTNPNGIMYSTVKDLPQTIFTYPNKTNGMPTYPQGARITYPQYECPSTIAAPVGAVRNPISPSAMMGSTKTMSHMGAVKTGMGMMGDTRAPIGCFANKTGQLSMLCSYDSFGTPQAQGDINLARAIDVGTRTTVGLNGKTFSQNPVAENF